MQNPLICSIFAVVKRDTKGTQVPCFFTQQHMIAKEDVIRSAEKALSEIPGMFLVDVSVSKDNVIEVTVESSEGSVSLDNCADISRSIESGFDREKEDFELTVGSAGLDMPFKVLRQYTKAVGSQVEVQFKGGRKLCGLLIGASERGIDLRYEALESIEGKKRRVRVTHEERFGFDEINTVKYHIIFK